MADLTPNERLQPCLLDRLTDHEPGNRKESRDKRVFSLRQLRGAVARDLAWLLNTPSRLAEDGLEGFPEVEKSVLNYGVPDLCGRVASGLDIPELERLVAQAVLRFEPRLLRHTLRVRAVYDAYEMSTSSLSFEVTGDLWALPVPDPM